MLPSLESMLLFIALNSLIFNDVLNLDGSEKQSHPNVFFIYLEGEEGKEGSTFL